MTDLSGITITTGILPSHVRENLFAAVQRIGAKVVDGVRIDTTHFVTTEGRGVQWEKANELNIPVVRPEWVEACERAGRILGVTKFYLDAVRVGAVFDERPGTAGTVGSGSAPPPPPPPPKEQKVQSPVQTRTEVTVEKPKDESPEPVGGSEKEQQQQKEEGEKKAEEQPSQSAEEKPLPSRPKVTVEDEKEEEEEEEKKAEATAAEEKEGSSGDEKGGKSPGDSSFQDVAL